MKFCIEATGKYKAVEIIILGQRVEEDEFKYEK